MIPGCGLGHDVAALARAGHWVQGLDISPEAALQANAQLRDEGLSSARVDVGDFLHRESLRAASIDALIEHTCYCAIEPQERASYVESAAHVLKPGGLLLGAFLDFEGGGPPFGTSPVELRASFAPHFEFVALDSAPERFLPKDVPQLAAVLRRVSSA